MFENERSFLKRSSTASYVVILYFNKMRLLSMKKNLKDPMNENEDAAKNVHKILFTKNISIELNLQFVIKLQIR